jgi:mRNA interferase MazF
MREILKGDIYYADLGPGLLSEQRGVRPVVILQNNYGNEHLKNVIVAPITKQKKTDLPTHVKLLKSKFSFFKKDSIILTEQVKTINKKNLKNYKGSLDDITMIKVENALQISFGMFR